MTAAIYKRIYSTGDPLDLNLPSLSLQESCAFKLLGAATEAEALEACNNTIKEVWFKYISRQFPPFVEEIESQINSMNFETPQDRDSFHLDKVVKDFFSKKFPPLAQVKFLIDKEEFKKAERIAFSVKKGLYQEELFAEIFNGYVIAKNLSDAKKIACLLRFPSYRIQAFRALSRLFIDAKNLPEAEESALLLATDRRHQQIYLMKIFKEYLKAKNLPEAKRIALLIPPSMKLGNQDFRKEYGMRNSALEEITKEFIKAKNLSEAEKCALLIKVYKLRVFSAQTGHVVDTLNLFFRNKEKCLKQIALAYIDANKLDIARRIAFSMLASHNKDSVLKTLSAAYIAAGELHKARLMPNFMKDPHMRDDVLTILVKAYIDKGDLKTAEDIAKLIQSNSKKKRLSKKIRLVKYEPHIKSTKAFLLLITVAALVKSLDCLIRNYSLDE